MIALVIEKKKRSPPVLRTDLEGGKRPYNLSQTPLTLRVLSSTKELNSNSRDEGPPQV
jgi:hypothetical protein